MQMKFLEPRPMAPIREMRTNSAVQWLTKGTRVIVTSDGRYCGHAGRAMRPDSRYSWIVILDGNSFALSFHHAELAPDPIAP